MKSENSLGISEVDIGIEFERETSVCSSDAGKARVWDVLDGVVFRNTHVSSSKSTCDVHAQFPGWRPRQ